MKKLRITVDGKTYEVEVEILGSSIASVTPVAAPAPQAVAAPAPAAAAVVAAPAPVRVNNAEVVRATRTSRAPPPDDGF